MRNCTLLLVLFASGAGAALAQDISGDWQGTIKTGDRETGRYRYLLHIDKENGSWCGTIRRIDQRIDWGGLAIECEERDRHAIGNRTRDAQLPRMKTLEEFDFAQAPQIPAAKIRELAEGGYIAGCAWRNSKKRRRACSTSSR